MVEDGAFAYNYGDIITISPALVATGGTYTITVDSTDISQVNQHFPTAKVSLVDFPEAELITSAFTITVRMNCLYIDILNSQWTSNTM